MKIHYTTKGEEKYRLFYMTGGMYQNTLDVPRKCWNQKTNLFGAKYFKAHFPIILASLKGICQSTGKLAMS